VVIAMSGGVDSSVAAALLVEQGYEVIGMMLRLWSEDGRQADNRCCTPDAMALARRVAAHLEIPFYVIDAQQSHYDSVVQYFIDGYAKGLTPNPCLACNRQVRWGFLLDHALALGADYMATGHYARVQSKQDGTFILLKGKDVTKDQSYILHILDQKRLSQSLFPLGNLTKQEVRQKAREFGLPTAERAESQDLCFLGGDDYRAFLARNAPGMGFPGDIKNRAGQLLGHHQGLSDYTIGQRKGLGISANKPLYVLEKDITTNTLIVGEMDELGCSSLTAASINWIAGQPPASSFRSQVKIRYKSHEVWANVTPNGASIAEATFDHPLRDITPGQAAVFFDDQICLGGGVIQ
jgi:tRNA-uridine 2-sulfurtransferase